MKKELQGEKEISLSAKIDLRKLLLMPKLL